MSLMTLAQEEKLLAKATSQIVTAGLALAMAKGTKLKFNADEYTIWHDSRNLFTLDVNGQRTILRRTELLALMHGISDEWTLARWPPRTKRPDMSYFEDWANGMISLARLGSRNDLAVKAEAQLYRETNTAFTPSLADDQDEDDPLQTIYDMSDDLKVTAEIRTLTSRDIRIR